MKRFLSLLLGFLVVTIGVHAQDSDVGTPPDSVWLENPNIIITEISGGWEPLGLHFSPEDENVNNSMSWIYDNEGIVEIGHMEDGYRIKALSFGSTSFTGTTVNGLTVNGTATVEGIMFGEYYLNMNIGESALLNITTSSDEIYNAIEWRISNPEVATVSQNGEVTALSAGETVIEATANVNGRYYWRHVFVTVHPEQGKIALSQDKISLQVGNIYALGVIFPKGEDSVNGTWSCSDQNIIKFEDSDEVTSCRFLGVSNGTTTITYTTETGVSASCEITVYTEINNYTLNAEQANLVPGETFQIEVTTDPENAGQTFTYRSENEDVATVDANGLVTAVGYGETTIAVNPEQQGWPTKWLRVDVAQMPESVWLENPDIQINSLNDYQSLNVQFSPDSDEINRTIDWTVSEDGIIVIEEWGNGNYYVSGRNFGTVNITGTTPNGLTVEGTATVSGIKFDSDEFNLTVGETASLGLTASSNDILNAINWGVRNPEIISLSTNGTVTALSTGSATVNAEAYVNDNWYNASTRIIVHPEQGSVALSCRQDLIQENNVSTIKVILPLGDENYNGTWSISDENVVRIEDNNWDWCTLKGIANGTAIVTYTLPNGATASCEVTVYTYINDFTLNAEQANLVPGETFQIEVTTDPENAGQTFTYRSDNEDVATVDANGLVTAVGYGETTIAVNPEQQGWPTRWLRVNVAQMPESVELLSKEINITTNYWYQVNLKFNPDSDDINKDMTWTFNNDDIVQVDNWGGGRYYMCGLNFGETEFTGTTADGKISVTGIAKVAGIRFANRDLDIIPGDVVPFEITTSSDEIRNAILWEYDHNVISVSEDGVVTALEPGQTTVYARSKVNNVEYVMSTEVRVHPTEGVAITQKSITLSIDGNYWINVLYPIGDNNDNGTWSISDESIARIGNIYYRQCEVIGVAPGTTTLTYTTPDGASSSCQITVYSQLNDFTLNTSETTLGTGETFQIEIIYADPENHGQTFTYRSENEEVATVDENGLVTAVGVGETYIQVYPEQQGWPTRWLRVTVQQMPESFEILNPEITFNGIDIITLVDLAFTPDNDEVCKDLTWESSDPNIGYIIKIGGSYYYSAGYNFGTANLTLTTANGLTQDAVINVRGIKIAEKANRLMYMQPGESVQFTAEASSPEILEGYNWGATNPEVVSVDENGLATAHMYGEAEVNVNKILDRTWYRDWVNIQVKPAPGTVGLNTESITMRVGEWNSIEAFLPAYEEDYWGSWSSSNDNVVEIISQWNGGWRNGCEFQALNIGEAVLTYTSNTGITASCVVTVTANVDGISLNAYELNDLQPGDTFQIEATTYPVETGAQYIYQSEYSDVASVDDNGLITINGYGETTIHVYLAENPSIEATISVKVEVLPTEIKIENNELEMTDASASNGIVLDLTLDFPEDLTTEEEDYINDEIVWTYEPEGIVEVVKETYEEYDPVRNPMRRLSPRVLKERYVVRPTGLKLGDVKVTGTTANNLEATFNVTVAGLAFPYGNMVLEIGESQRVDVEADPAELADRIEWTVSDSNVIDLADGIVTAKSAGVATVTATAEYNGTTYSGSFNVTVSLKQPTGLVALKESINLSVGEKVTYAVKDLFEVQPTEDVDDNLWIYTTDNNVMRVSEEWRDGLNYVTLEAVNEGDAKLFAYTNNGYYADIQVNVTNEPLEITLSESKLYIYFFNKKQLTATVTPSDREVEITWSSSAPRIVSVDENGVITANGVGSAVITATATDKNGATVSASCEVFVIFFSGVEEILEDGETCDIYTVDGIVLKKDANTNDLKSLNKGVYVIKKGADTFKIQI